LRGGCNRLREQGKPNCLHWLLLRKPYDVREMYACANAFKTIRTTGVSLTKALISMQNSLTWERLERALNDVGYTLIVFPGCSGTGREDK